MKSPRARKKDRRVPVFPILKSIVEALEYDSDLPGGWWVDDVARIWRYNAESFYFQKERRRNV